MRGLSWRNFDLLLFGAAVLASAFGAMMIRSAIAGNENLAGYDARQVYFAIAGAVIVDADIVFGLFSGRCPALYMFTHGGFAHSITGSVVMSGLSIAGIQLAVLAGVLPARAAGISLILSFSVLLAGALIHLGIDALAYPGIPLLYPLSDRKMTAGILPGPSILLFVTTGSLAVLWFAGWVAASTAVWTAAAVLVLFLCLRAGVFLLVRSRQLQGRCVPTANPLQWIITDEDMKWVSVARYSLICRISGQARFMKYTNTNSTETEPFLSLPEVRRLLRGHYARGHAWPVLALIDLPGAEVALDVALRGDRDVNPCGGKVRLLVEAGVGGGHVGELGLAAVENLQLFHT